SGEDDLVVFPSNQQLALRAHGMPASTLRRHLAALVDAGLIIRRDSPNGKRYARKGRGGEIELAFGFELSPLVVRAEEFEILAAEIEADARA
ncbi:plasmid replication protein RepC, partial [Pseudomonas aeruginosa]